jgi:hypothetical protein
MLRRSDQEKRRAPVGGAVLGQLLEEDDLAEREPMLGLTTCGTACGSPGIADGRTSTV